MRNAILFLCLLICLLGVACAPNLESGEQTKFDINQITAYNMHDHIEGLNEGPIAKDAMRRAGIDHLLLVASPESTILLGKEGFFGYDKSNDIVLELASNDDYFIPFCTIKPEDEHKLEKLKDCQKRGNKGLKLYSGHTMFYNLALNTSSMQEVFAYAEEEQIPILFHINPARVPVRLEMESILQKYPNLKINCPHFCLSSINETRFRYLMDTYPNLYSDISFGFFVEPGFKRISKNPAKFTKIFEDYGHRIMFATDMVLTSHPRKTEEWVHNMTMCYRGMLEVDEYTCKVAGDLDGIYRGLELRPEVLENIYQHSAEDFLGIN